MLLPPVGSPFRGAVSAIDDSCAVIAHLEAEDRMFTRLHHMQLSMPRGGEQSAREFYGDVLGMTEVDKPPALAARGGVWFRAGGVELHLGVEVDFRPAGKGHPGILTNDLDRVVARLERGGHDAAWDDNFPGFRRVYAHDPFGNRLEFLEALPSREAGHG